MICDLINLVTLLVVLGLAYYLIMLIPMKEPFPQIIRIATIIIAVLCVLGTLFGGIPVPHIKWMVC